ncbi:NUDIX domain-containing protein [Streptomyces sp. SDr-06]|uniref:NUDIX hydrolase n=1 Tax=Streptomyces sp. SDr-06 TaxID=2267702 RepID=UPI000DEA82C4|nr:NUDIX domain-containing protein [Streptomyces sp. SDr-06]RCH65477.1 NUDIX domain-containing protein [Streptomyces sp. SDr-06]
MGGRIEYWYAADAPKPNSLIPACNMLVAREDGAILLQRRRDTGQWALPGGAMEIGESPSQCAVRECKEETGIDAVATGLLGVYSPPEHVVAYADGEIRQAYEVTVLGRPVGGEPTINDEADGVRWVLPSELGSYDIHPSMLRQIGHFLEGAAAYVD